MLVVLVSDILLKTLVPFFSLLSFSVLLINCGSPKSEKAKLSKKSSGTKDLSKTSSGTDQKVIIKKSEDDVKFDVKVKKVEKKKDEFDDDEENPLAKIPTKARLPKPKNGAAGGAAPPGEPGLNGEIPLLANNEKNIGASCYAKAR
uniref:Uncharacterized protein n=1 Tax=Caenorhabditis japonica TaxID=281687 RepID=A0A8R1DFL0_CAEJA